MADLLGIPVEVFVSQLDGDALAGEWEVIKAHRIATPTEQAALLKVARMINKRHEYPELYADR